MGMPPTSGWCSGYAQANIIAIPQALAFEYENGHGTASFVPDGGARVEVHVEVLRVEIR